MEGFGRVPTLQCICFTMQVEITRRVSPAAAIQVVSVLANDMLLLTRKGTHSWRPGGAKWPDASNGIGANCVLR